MSLKQEITYLDVKPVPPPSIEHPTHKSIEMLCFPCVKETNKLKYEKGKRKYECGDAQA